MQVGSFDEWFGRSSAPSRCRHRVPMCCLSEGRSDLTNSANHTLCIEGFEALGVEGCFRGHVVSPMMETGRLSIQSDPRVNSV